MRTIALATALLLSAVVSALAVGMRPALAQGASTCDITDLPCWGPGTKCNIKFRNKTGLASGSEGGEHNQISRASTLKISPVDANGKRVGSNTLTILAGASNTMNLDKKKGFNAIRIRASGPYNVTMKCSDIRKTLSGTGKCDIFVADPGGYGWLYLAYKCAGGSVVY